MHPRKKYSLGILLLCLSTPAFGMKVFDMEEIRDPSTLQIKVLQDWRKVQGPIATRQKLVTINVGDLWPGQEYRVPVRMVVPADRKAKGFHLTGGSSPSRLQKDARPNPTERALLEGGVGLVITVVQEPGSYGQREMAHASEKKFAESLNPRFKIQYWAWPTTLMPSSSLLTVSFLVVLFRTLLSFAVESLRLPGKWGQKRYI